VSGEFLVLSDAPYREEAVRVGDEPLIRLRDADRAVRHAGSA
jgi:hypothetical protein